MTGEMSFSSRYKKIPTVNLLPDVTGVIFMHELSLKILASKMVAEPVRGSDTVQLHPPAPPAINTDHSG